MREPRFGITRSGHKVHATAIDHMPVERLDQRINKKLASLITTGVGTMWCAYIFALFDCLALPNAIKQGTYGLVQWTASFFLQLVLLSIVMVKQNIDGLASDARAAKTFEDAEDIKQGTKLVKDLLDLETPGGITTLLEAINERQKTS